MAPALFVAGQGVDAHQLGELEKVGDSSRPFQRLIERFAVPEDADVVPEFISQLRDAHEGFAQSGLVPRHAAFVPEKQTELAVEGIDGAFSIYRQQLFGPGPDLIFRVAKFRAICRRPLPNLRSE